MQLETMREIVVLQSFCSADRRLRRSLGLSLYFSFSEVFFLFPKYAFSGCFHLKDFLSAVWIVVHVTISYISIVTHANAQTALII